MNLTLGFEHPFDAEFEKIQKWLNNSRRAADTQLVTKEHILEPPFRARYEIKDGIVEVTISGSNDSIVVRCNRVVTSQFRTKQLDLFLFDESGTAVSRRALATM